MKTKFEVEASAFSFEALAGNLVYLRVEFLTKLVRQSQGEDETA